LHDAPPFASVLLDSWLIAPARISWVWRLCSFAVPATELWASASPPLAGSSAR